MPFSQPFTPIVFEPAFFLWDARQERILPHFIERLELLNFGEGFAAIRVPPKNANRRNIIACKRKSGGKTIRNTRIRPMVKDHQDCCYRSSRER